jgi:hypothetical protein
MDRNPFENFTSRVEQTLYDWLTKPLWGSHDGQEQRPRVEEHAPVVPATSDEPPAAPSTKPLPLHRQAREAPRVKDVHATQAVLAGAHNRLKSLLLQPQGTPEFKRDVEQTGQSLSSAVSKNPDGSLFHLMQGTPDKFAIYSVVHSMQCAVACGLVADRLGWSTSERDSLVSAALTMNISMAKLQDELAVQSSPPTPQQRQVIREHPFRGVEVLQQSGVNDELWLRTVREHHESPDGKGYPLGIAASFEPAEVLRHVDIFMAKLKSRANRKAITPSQAVREIFLDSGNSRIAGAVIKEFGIYPPGVFVRLANGELGIAVARGEAINSPMVAVLINKNGESSPNPVRRDTGDPQFAVVSVVNDANVMAKVDPGVLFS